MRIVRRHHSFWLPAEGKPVVAIVNVRRGGIIGAVKFFNDTVAVVVNNIARGFHFLVQVVTAFGINGNGSTISSCPDKLRVYFNQCNLIGRNSRNKISILHEHFIEEKLNRLLAEIKFVVIKKLAVALYCQAWNPAYQPFKYIELRNKLAC